MTLCNFIRCEDPALDNGICERHQDRLRGEQHDPFDPTEHRSATLEKALRAVRFELLLHDTDAMGRDRKWVWELKKRIDSALEGR